MTPEHYEKTWAKCTNKHIASFVETKDKFESSSRGIKWLQMQEYSKKGCVYVSNGEFIYEDLKELNKIKDSKVLIVGGGPSASDFDWDADDYDYIISLNHFYKSEKLKGKKVDIAFVGNEVDTNSRDFLKYYDNNDTLIAIEDLEHRAEHVKNLQKKYVDRTFLCSSRIQCKSLGAGPKLITFALSLGAKQVDVIGIDGVSKDYDANSVQDHAFEQNKTYDKKYSYEIHLHHYRTLNFYIENTFPNQTVNNLGAGHPYNCWSHI